MNTSSITAVYISHGGGPLPLLGDEAHKGLIANLQTIADAIEKPSAIIVISAHWEEARPTITSGANPSLIYDYYGFPKASYEIEYPVPGEPQLAQKIYDLLRERGIDAVLDEQRGFDHGLFVPLKIMYPDADIPCIQLSLLNTLNPAEHIRMGEALAGLNSENVLVVGSGFSFHNMKAFFSPPSADKAAMNLEFEAWLQETCVNHAVDEARRANSLVNWADAPSARYCHPREEHLLPLHVCYGAAKHAAEKVYTFDILGVKASAYLW